MSGLGATRGPAPQEEIKPIAWVASVFVGLIMEGDALVDAVLWGRQAEDGSRVPLYDHSTIEALEAESNELLAALKAMMSDRMNGPDSALIWYQAKEVIEKAEGRTPAEGS
jgi:hypothetical protein